MGWGEFPSIPRSGGFIATPGMRDIQRLTERCERLEEALAKAGIHAADCPVSHYGLGCNCWVTGA